jgi:purine nucleosidase
MNWPKIDEATRIARLEPPKQRPIPMVLDTDTYNEVDDQFALAYALLEGSFDVQAVYAAPFHNSRSEGPEDGMERSYREIHKLLDLMELEDRPVVLRGAGQYMTAPDTPVDSPAARDLIERAMTREPEDPLYVVTIGCPVNVASALLLEPELVHHIVLVWLGGNPSYWPTADEFNLMQDVYASQILFDCGAPLVVMPCQQVTDHLSTTVPELVYYLQDASPLGRYLCSFVTEYAKEFHAQVGWSKVIWDPITVVWMTHPEAVATRLTPTPLLQKDLRYSQDMTRPLMREAYQADRDAILGSLFRLLGTPRSSGADA